MPILKKVQAFVLSGTLAAATPILPADAAAGARYAELQNQEGAQAMPAPVSAHPSQNDLQQIVAPIALYPDALVAQVLAGSTYPSQVVEADRWLQENKNLKGDQLAAEVDKQSWDPSIKALSQFPDVLNNMSKNLSWTSALGDAYFNDPNGVMNAIQVLRKEAQKAGNLKSTSQQTVKTEGQTIVITPASPEVVYVPTYSPAVVYGTPIAAYPGYSGWSVAAASAVSFGVGMAVGGAFNNSWGWRSWGTDWRGGAVQFNHNTYVSRSNTFVNRNTSFNNASRTNVNRNLSNRSFDQLNRSGTRSKPTYAQAGTLNRERGNAAANRGFGNFDRSSVGKSGGAFNGFSQGGSARLNSARGHSSFGGGQFGGGGRAGGFRAGGRRR
jgi:hypothetical protein